MGLLHPEHRITDLRGQVSGAVLTPDDTGYEDARKAWNLLFDPHPAYILMAENAEDIAAGVRFAAEAGIGAAVQSTGHGIKTPSDDGLLIITSSRMNAVTVDPAARTARAESGALWHQVIEQAAPHGLAPLLGSSPHVGVVGYTLGGGIGWLGRPYGLAADSVTSIDIVTADGELRHASAGENADLFWAARGGGGAFGAVTAIEFALYPVASLYGGFMVFGGDRVAEALRFFRDWAGAAPDALTSSIAVVKFPNLPFVPEPVRGKTQVVVRAAYVGDAEAGAALIKPWLGFDTPQENTFRQMPFTDIATISNDPVNPTAGYGVNEMFDTLTDEAIEVIARNATNPASPLVANEIRHAGGAISRVPVDANAIGNRGAQFILLMGGPAFSPEILEAIKGYIPGYRAELAPYVSGGAYLNFTIGLEAHKRVKDAFAPATIERLAAIKAKYDPDNVFRFAFHFA